MQILNPIEELQLLQSGTPVVCMHILGKDSLYLHNGHADLIQRVKQTHPGHAVVLRVMTDIEILDELCNWASPGSSYHPLSSNFYDPFTYQQWAEAQGVDYMVEVLPEHLENLDPILAGAATYIPPAAMDFDIVDVPALIAQSAQIAQDKELVTYHFHWTNAVTQSRILASLMPFPTYQIRAASGKDGYGSWSTKYVWENIKGTEYKIYAPISDPRIGLDLSSTATRMRAIDTLTNQDANRVRGEIERFKQQPEQFATRTYNPVWAQEMGITIYELELILPATTTWQRAVVGGTVL